MRLGISISTTKTARENESTIALSEIQLNNILCEIYLAKL